MKRSWFGLFLLLALLAVSLFASRKMVAIHEENAHALEEAARYAMKDNWAGAAYATAQAKYNWEKWDLLRSALADHTPGEEVDALFAALEIYGSVKDKVAFSALCRELSQKIHAIGDAHRLKVHNLL